MDGRQRVLDAAHGHQPAIRWELDAFRSSRTVETWRHVDGYELEIWYGRKSSRSIRAATLTAPAPDGVRPLKCFVFHSDLDKAGVIVRWLADPAHAIIEDRGVRV